MRFKRTIAALSLILAFLATGCSASNGQSTPASTLASGPASAAPMAPAAVPAATATTASPPATTGSASGKKDCSSLSFAGQLKQVFGPSAVLKTSMRAITGHNNAVGVQILCWVQNGQVQYPQVAINYQSDSYLSDCSKFVSNDPTDPMGASGNGSYQICFGKGTLSAAGVSSGTPSPITTEQASELAHLAYKAKPELDVLGADCISAGYSCEY
ncbi:hypothetical protein [Sinomonas soli]